MMFRVGDMVQIEVGSLAGQRAVVANASEPGWVWVQLNGGIPSRYRVYEVSYLFDTMNVDPVDTRPAGEAPTLPTDSQERKDTPITSGVLDYFPAAIAEVAKVSKAGNDKHNPGEALHWARGKSTDQADCIARHLIERGTIDPEDGQRHSAKLAWRALALLQEELEAEGAPISRGSKEG